MNIKSFTACGQIYHMGDSVENYIESLKKDLIEIRENSLKAKSKK